MTELAQITHGKVTGARTYFGLTSALRLGEPQT